MLSGRPVRSHRRPSLKAAMMGVCGVNEKRFVAVPVDLFEGEWEGRMGGGEEEK